MGLHQKALEKLGLGVAAISYDSPAVLRNFAERKQLGYSLLSDPESQIIDKFGIRNEAATSGFAKGIPHPGLFIVDPKGVVQAKHFEDDYRERLTISSLLTGRFGERAQAGLTTVERERITVTTAASAAAVRGGQKLRLTLDAKLGQGLHAYAPGAPADFIPVRWTIAESTGWKAGAPQWPAAEKAPLFGSTEKIPSYHGAIAVSREITLGTQQALEKLAAQGEFTLNGDFLYQACNDKLCYPPERVPVSWKFTLESHDRTRVPAELQRK